MPFLPLYVSPDPTVHACARTHTRPARAAEAAFTLGNEEFVKENWKAALEHFSQVRMCARMHVNIRINIHTNIYLRHYVCVYVYKYYHALTGGCS
jgi:hypothetical protein